MQLHPPSPFFLNEGKIYIESNPHIPLRVCRMPWTLLLPWLLHPNTACPHLHAALHASTPQHIHEQSTLQVHQYQTRILSLPPLSPLQYSIITLPHPQTRTRPHSSTDGHHNQSDNATNTPVATHNPAAHVKPTPRQHATLVARIFMPLTYFPIQPKFFPLPLPILLASHFPLHSKKPDHANTVQTSSTPS